MIRREAGQRQVDIWGVVQILALFVSILFGAWKLDDHFVTRSDFRTLQESVARIEAAVHAQAHP